VELYVHDENAKIDRPLRELKGFERIELRPGETETATFMLNRAALSYWNPKTKAWQADPGTFDIEVGGEFAGYPATRAAQV